MSQYGIVSVKIEGKLFKVYPLSSSLSPLTVHDAYSAVNDKMQRMVVNHANRFELLREAFNVPLKKHEDIQDEIKGSILDMVENFSGDITVKGMSLLNFKGLLISVVMPS